MIKKLSLLVTIPALLLICGCSHRDAARIVRIATAKDIGSAAKIAAKSKALGYAQNPYALSHDFQSFKKILAKFSKTIGGNWGNDEIVLPTPKQYVKYTQNYLSRALVDFDAGKIVVETIDNKTPIESLREAIIITLLTPNDPRSVDLYSASPVRLGDVPFLLGEVLDENGHSIRWEWRAKQFANSLIKAKLKKRMGNDKKTIYFVSIPMVQDHLHVRAAKYKPFVHKAAKRFQVSPNLIYAIMKVESDFNPFAISHAMAVGLMQVVPTTAGRDVYQLLHGRKGSPSQKALLDPPTNILYGTGYLHMLQTRFLSGIEDPTSREYCIIASYNGGAGAVLRSFASKKNKAKQTINTMSPMQVYKQLQSKLPHEETRRYLVKVLHAKKEFVNNTL